jgi:hypothetical protein
MLLARWRSHCCAACVSPVSNNVQFPWAAFEPLWQLASLSSFCIKNAETMQKLEAEQKSRGQLMAQCDFMIFHASSLFLGIRG